MSSLITLLSCGTKRLPPPRVGEQDYRSSFTFRVEPADLSQEVFEFSFFIEHVASLSGELVMHEAVDACKRGLELPEAALTNAAMLPHYAQYIQQVISTYEEVSDETHETEED